MGAAGDGAPHQTDELRAQDAAVAGGCRNDSQARLLWGVGRVVRRRVSSRRLARAGGLWKASVMSMVPDITAATAQQSIQIPSRGGFVGPSWSDEVPEESFPRPWPSSQMGDDPSETSPVSGATFRPASVHSSELGVTRPRDI